MSLLFIAELFLLYVFGGALLMLLAFASWDWLRDVAARRRMNVLIAVEVAHAEADQAPDLFAHALEEIRNLPTREHPPAFGGWRG
jgi:hypothetical protein